MPYSPEQEERRKQLEHDLSQANLEKSAIVSTEHKEHRQRVLKQFDDEATTKFWELMRTFRDNTVECFYALADIEAVRGLTPSEKRVKVGLLQLEMCKAALSCFTPKAHALKERRITP